MKLVEFQLYDSSTNYLYDLDGFISMKEDTTAGARKKLHIRLKDSVFFEFVFSTETDRLRIYTALKDFLKSDKQYVNIVLPILAEPVR